MYSKCFRGTNDGSKIAGVLKAGNSHQQQIVAAMLNHILQLCRFELDQRGDALRFLGADGAGKSFIGEHQSLRVSGDLREDSHRVLEAAVAENDRVEA